jgi:hypothetical protein
VTSLLGTGKSLTFFTVFSSPYRYLRILFFVFDNTIFPNYNLYKNREINRIVIKKDQENKLLFLEGPKNNIKNVMFL